MTVYLPQHVLHYVQIHQKQKKYIIYQTSLAYVQSNLDTRVMTEFINNQCCKLTQQVNFLSQHIILITLIKFHDDMCVSRSHGLMMFTNTCTTSSDIKIHNYNFLLYTLTICLNCARSLIYISNLILYCILSILAFNTTCIRELTRVQRGTSTTVVPSVAHQRLVGYKSMMFISLVQRCILCIILNKVTRDSHQISDW